MIARVRTLAEVRRDRPQLAEETPDVHSVCRRCGSDVAVVGGLVVARGLWVLRCGAWVRSGVSCDGGGREPAEGP